jgi:hypothetical protein
LEHSKLEPVLEGDDRLSKEAQRMPFDVREIKRRVSSPMLPRQRSRYFEQVFATSRETAPRADEEAIRAQSMVLAELKTNVYV